MVGCGEEGEGKKEMKRKPGIIAIFGAEMYRVENIKADSILIEDSHNGLIKGCDFRYEKRIKKSGDKDR